MELYSGEYLDVIEQGILYAWGCPDYAMTMERLKLLGAITVDPMLRKHIFNLRSKLIRAHISDWVYSNRFLVMRRDLAKDATMKFDLAKQAMEMEREGKNE